MSPALNPDTALLPDLNNIIQGGFKSFLDPSMVLYCPFSSFAYSFVYALAI